MKKQIIDQSAHFAAALVALAPAALWPGVASFAFAGAALGLVREITEPGPVLSAGSLLDILFWTLGGAAAGLLVELA